MNDDPLLDFVKRHATIPPEWRLLWFLRGMLNPSVGKSAKEKTEAQVQKCVSEMQKMLYKNPKYQRLVLDEFRERIQNISRPE